MLSKFLLLSSSTEPFHLSGRHDSHHMSSKTPEFCYDESITIDGDPSELDMNRLCHSEVIQSRVPVCAPLRAHPRDRPVVRFQGENVSSFRKCRPCTLKRFIRAIPVVNVLTFVCTNACSMNINIPHPSALNKKKGNGQTHIQLRSPPSVSELYSIPSNPSTPPSQPATYAVCELNRCGPRL